MDYRGDGGRRLRLVVPLGLVWILLHRTVLGCSSTDCNLVLTEAQGQFSSPCYPQKYPNSKTCKWTMQAPAGFIIQLSFLDFELEEAQGCIYDRVEVNTGVAEVKFCGLTASGLSLNSTGNVMELSFMSDFSIQKKGFSVSFQHVAVALRNQKVAITGGNGKVTKVTESVSIPTLTELTVCFEVERSSQKEEEWLFSYYDGSSAVRLALGSAGSGMQLVVGDVSCSVDSIISSSDFTRSMRPFCVLWTSSNGRVGVFFNGNYRGKTCSSSSGRSVPAGGLFQLGGEHSFGGNIYNLRVWSRAMTVPELNALTCEAVGDVLDWDNGHWSIPSSLAQTDGSLSCSANTPPSTSCDPPGLGCPAASSPATSITDSTNTTHATNTSTHVASTSTFSSTSTSISTFSSTSTSISPSTPSASMSLSPTSTSSSSSSAAAATSTSSASSSATVAVTTSAATSASTATNVASSSSTAHAEQTSGVTPATSSAPTTNPATNPATHGSSLVSSPQTSPGSTPVVPLLTSEQPTTNIAATAASPAEGLFYRVSFLAQSRLDLQDVERAAVVWLNQTFQNWTHVVDELSVRPAMSSGGTPTSYSFQALLLISNQSLGEDGLLARLTGAPVPPAAGLDLQSKSVSVQLIENCEAENLLHYRWPETRPRTTQYLPCFPNKDQRASRTCWINPESFTSSWSPANFTNCTVTAENAAGVAEQLANFTRNNLSNDEVSQVVMKVKELVQVARIDTAVAETVVNIISNVMLSSETAPVNTNNRALRAVQELAQKVEFAGPSINISSRNLALGVVALNSATFNGTLFSAFIPPNSTDPKIEFEPTISPLAQVTLPSSLLSGVSPNEAAGVSLSRINFLFFSSTNLFKKDQNSLSLNSYVVASSVGNVSIRDLKDPVKIEIAHLLEPVQASAHRECVFWDFSLNKGDGGWNKSGCSVSAESTSNRTICLCNHLTHFGILMDVSQSSSRIDPENKKVLTFLSYIGCGISAICSAATLLTYIAFEKLRRDYPSKILMNLSSSLLFLNMAFLLNGWLASMVDSQALCLAAAVLLHYFLLTSFTWMGLESVHMYIALVKVFNTYIRRYILKFCIVGWGVPAVLVGIVVSVDKNFYGVLEDSEDDSAKMCWVKDMSVFYTTVVGYFCLVFLLNVAMFIVVMMQICGRNGKRSNRTFREEVLRNLRSVVSLTFLLGMTWGFALFAWGPVYLAFTYLFTIFNSLQGLFIFIFHCALKENVQKQWRRYLCCGPYRLSENSDWSKTPTNNTKKVSSDNLAKSLSSSSSFGSSSSTWASKAKATLTPFSRKQRNAESSSSQ
ncbi:adhesion G-protein coupled receptor G6 isoform X2 [Cololabis saira]|uniref:adhesion G-protein coupled receptor G6 isoform X2 n=1 Tax=Cololabis saira TaxID=129043 RepID=UPI002AD413AF|nr:adhesion G-protein coupled receptor G6 isoform X2 [Cololabis saira]XP_061602267.1 adhesion G-protein coupled receptor G6 isoform X2 [Cololabis saira]